MSVHIINVTKNIEIGIKGRTLKPSCGDVFSDDIAEQPGVVAYIKKGWLKAEMVKEIPGGLSAGEIKKTPEKEVKKASEKEVKKESEKEVKGTETGIATPAK